MILAFLSYHHHHDHCESQFVTRVTQVWGVVWIRGRSPRWLPHQIVIGAQPRQSSHSQSCKMGGQSFLNQQFTLQFSNILRSVLGHAIPKKW